MENPSLEDRFPGLQVGKKPSGLGSVNGCGTSLVGNRDFDPETGTYVITHVITAVFIPILALAAYRVARSENGGWYCIGRVPLSRFARSWNLILILSITISIGGVAWYEHTKSPDYVAGRKLDDAEKAAAAGHAGQAAKLYREVIEGRTSKSDEASRRLAALMEDPGSPSEAAEVYSVAVDLDRDHRCPVPNPFEKGKALALKYAVESPEAAVALLEVIAPLSPDAPSEIALRIQLLEKLFAKSPGDPEIASRLAVAYEVKGDREKCEQILAPLEGKLGTLDGAASLGRIYAARGQYDKANALLEPFVASRLPALRNAEQGLTGQFKAAEDRVIQSLRTGKAPNFDYKVYERSSKDKQGAMVDEYVSEQLKSDTTLRTARKNLIAQRAVVGAVLDLGLVQLQRGQSMTDPAARRTELEKAEKTFLSVRGFAGESDEYRLSLGQVYYWLGRPTDGKKMFDDLLASRNQSTDITLQIAHALREVGDTSEAKRLAEAAYNKEPDLQKKQQLAAFRALIRSDTDDEILWLTRANTDSLNVQADLATARGHKARRDGKDEAAIEQFHRALDVYTKMPDSAATFNNSALTLFALYEITHNREELTRGLDKLDRAIALKPSDSILLYNGATTAVSSAIRDVVGTEIDLKILKSAAGWETVAYLYRTPAERTAVMARISGHPATVKARTYAEKLIVLAPKRDESYQVLAGLCENGRDLTALKDVVTRAEKAEIDTQDDRREYLEFLSGKSDTKKLEDIRAGLSRTTETLNAARPVGGKTYAVAVGRYVRAKIGGWLLGESADPDELVKLADEVYAASPSSGTESILELALLFRAHQTMSKEDAGYASLAKKTRRSFSTSLVQFVLATDGPHRARAASNPDVKRLATIALESSRRYPEGVTAAEWILVRAVTAEVGAELAAKAKANERRQLLGRLSRTLSPFHASTAIGSYWDLLLEGKDAEAKKLLEKLETEGIPVP